MRKLKRKKAPGFTIIEVLISMVVLAIGLLGLAAITVVVLKSNTLSQQYQDATNLASNMMERIKLQGTLPDCDDAAVLADLTNCELLTESGIQGLSNFYPALTREEADCTIDGLLSGNDAFDTFDAGTNAGTVSAANSVCELSDDTFTRRQFVRYYRTFQGGDPSAPTTTIVVVVLWKDRFGKWRQVRFTTTR